MVTAKQTFESSYVILKVENSILYGIYKKDVTIDLSVAKLIVQQRLDFVDNVEYPALADTRGVKLVTKEARDYFARGDGVRGMKALAVLTGNPLTVIIANLFITFSRPKVPTKAFKTKEQAEKWLMQFINSE